jgi:methionine-rich copper-binding protein CopC
MNDKARSLLLSVASLMLAGQAMASTNTTTAADGDAYPVLVSLNAQGKVANIEVADRMPAAVTRVLRQDIEQAVANPAQNAPVMAAGGQFLAMMAPKATALADGKFAVDFTLVSAKPLPSGNFIWQRNQDNSLALVLRDSVRPGYTRQPVGADRMPQISQSVAVVPATQPGA